MAEPRKAKPKTTAKRKTAAKRKPVAKRKPAAKRAAPKKAARAQETGRKAFLASLGFYGKAYDQAQETFETLQTRMETRRKDADKAYKALVKRGEKLEKDAKGVIGDIELPKQLDSLTDRKKLEKQLKKVKARLDDLKQSVSFKSAA